MLTLRKFLSVVLALTILVMPALAEDRSILLVTARGVWQSDVVNGVPGPFVMKPYDVVIQGIGLPLPPDDSPIPPVPPTTDPQVVQIAAISKATLKDKDEAMAVAGLIDSLTKLNVRMKDLRETLVMAVPIGDTSLKAEGRLKKWLNEVLVVFPLTPKANETEADFSDRVKAEIAIVKTGLTSAFGITSATLDTIHAAAVAGPEAALTAEAVDWAKIIAYIQLIIQLLKNLGIIQS